MDIWNQGRGIHAREIPGLEKLKSLPTDWYAFTNLELTIGPGQSREIDIVMVIDDRVLLVDLKDWNAKITFGDGRWFHGGRDMGPSPVEKMRGNARKVAETLKAHLRDRAQSNPLSPKFSAPFFQGIVIQSGRASLDEIADNEKPNAFMLDDFVRFVRDPKERHRRIGSPQFSDTRNPLTTKDSRWRHVFERFFNASGGQFKPGRRRYGSYRASSDQPTFSHRSGAYIEFDVEDENAGHATGLLRRWDFSKLEARFQTETGRNEIAGRERKIFAYLNDRNPDVETLLLRPRVDDAERSVGYWEVFDRRRQLKRLSDFVATETRHLSNSNRIELARQVLARIKTIHDQDAAHLDLGPHSVWLEAPSIVRISHLLAARVPGTESLGQNRYQFLSVVATPEDVLGANRTDTTKDCFLLGAVVHQLLFDVPPRARQSNEPPEWQPSVDAGNSFSSLHGWFERALSWDIKTRHPDASVMLDEFNSALAESPTSLEVLERLERHRHWKSQRQVFVDLPSDADIKTDDRIEIWRSKYEGRQVLVKMWKRSAWGDQEREGPRLLAFLDKAEALRLSPRPGCAPICKVGWMPDAIVILQDWVDAETLETAIAAKTGPLVSGLASARFLKQLAELLTALHESGIAHGDLKPSNILVDESAEGAPVLIDYLELSAADDGDMVSTAYVPSSGGDRFCRDRYAVTKIAEEVFTACGLSGPLAHAAAQSIQKCRIGPPENSTLLPLVESLEIILAPPDAAEVPKLRFSIKNAETGPLLSDEGVFGLRFARGSPILFIRGASEEMGIRLNDGAQPLSGWRKTLEQKQISAISRHEFARVELEVEIVSAAHNDFSGLITITEGPAFREAWRTRPEGVRAAATDTAAADEANQVAAFGDVAEDELAESIAVEQVREAVDVPLLWRALITAEEELSIEGATVGESAYRRNRRRHLSAFELEEGTFDFNREDTVFVERLDRKGTWRELGILDVASSNPNLVAIDAGRRFPDAGDGLISDGTKLRFKSHFETTSRTRRDAATSRILDRRSEVRHLIDHFDPQVLESPSILPKIVDAREVKELYQLNDTQAEAFERLVCVQPVGLLQGPPGTGKTRFIGALVHFALTRNLARNVLLASQSHEAVNNAAEAVLRLFRAEDERPSIVRVGQEGSVSERLLPFHSGRVEASYKDGLQADLKARMRLIGGNLGLSKDASDKLTYIEQTIRPVVDRLETLRRIGGDDHDRRILGLRETFDRMTKRLDVDLPDVQEMPGDELLALLVRQVCSKHSITNAERAANFRAVVRLARDFAGSVSTQERSFETFLAGTRQIVAGTCVGLGRSSLGLTKTPFDLVIVDEAARCTSSELAVPIQSGRWIVLVGDQAQLEPHHRSEVIQEVAAATSIPKREIKRSDFERMFLSSYGSEASRQLTQQYRMLAPIGRIVSTAFYSQALTHERDTPEIDSSVLPKELNKVVTWVSTDGGGLAFHQREDPDGGTSLVNPGEADAIVALLRRWDAHEPFREFLIRQDNRSQTIGVICMYAAQRDLVRHKVRISGLSEAIKANMVIGTVDSYQGKENPIIILSLVRNNVNGPVQAGRATIREGFMIRPNRVNVAVSRAMDRLVVVGSRKRWPAGGPMNRVAAAFSSELAAGHAALVDATELRDNVEAGARASKGSKRPNFRRGSKNDRR
jgi:serine/threonine protein kinase